MKQISVGLVAAMIAALVSPIASAVTLQGVNWAADVAADGIATGTLGPLGVTLTSTNGPRNGGQTVAADWPTRAGSNDVPGISALAGANATAIDWDTGTTGFATIAFTGGLITDPILLFNFTDPNQTFDFADTLALTILDQSPPGSATISAGNVVTLNTTPGNVSNSGFTLQMLGTFSTISFSTNLSLLPAESMGFSIATDVSPIPEPSSMILASLGLFALLAAAHRQKGEA